MVDMDGNEWHHRRKLVVRNMFNNVHRRIERNICKETRVLTEKLNSLMKEVKGEQNIKMAEFTTDELAHLLSEFSGRVICVLLFGESWEQNLSKEELGHIREINDEFAHTAIILNHFAQIFLKYAFITFSFNLIFDSLFNFYS